MKRPVTIYTLGDYYGIPELRTICHLVKDGQVEIQLKAAVELAMMLPKESVLVPVPSRNGGTVELARLLGELTHLPVIQCLKQDSTESLYNLKKAGKKVTEADCAITLTGKAPEGNIVLVDNVIATGTTMSAAIEAIGRDCDAACLALDMNTYRQNL